MSCSECGSPCKGGMCKLCLSAQRMEEWSLETLSDDNDSEEEE